MQELVLHVSMVHKGYVSNMDCTKSKPFANVLFSLAEEAMGAAVTMQRIARMLSGKLAFTQPLQFLPEGTPNSPSLALRIAVTSNRCDNLHAHVRTGRLVRRFGAL